MTGAPAAPGEQDAERVRQRHVLRLTAVTMQAPVAGPLRECAFRRQQQLVGRRMDCGLHRVDAPSQRWPCPRPFERPPGFVVSRP